MTFANYFFWHVVQYYPVINLVLIHHLQIQYVGKAGNSVRNYSKQSVGKRFCATEDPAPNPGLGSVSVSQHVFCWPFRIRLMIRIRSLIPNPCAYSRTFRLPTAFAISILYLRIRFTREFYLQVVVKVAVC
jgi:hypothetical protein